LSKAPLQRQPVAALRRTNMQSLDGSSIYEARAVAEGLVFCVRAAIKVFAAGPEECGLCVRRRYAEQVASDGQRISLTGTFSCDVATDEITFSDQLKHIWEFEPHTVVTRDLLSERVLPVDLPRTLGRMEQMRAGFDNPDHELRLRMPGGRIKYLWVCARVVSEERAAPTSLHIALAIGLESPSVSLSANSSAIDAAESSPSGRYH
jgi:hypothetical protein